MVSGALLRRFPGLSPAQSKILDLLLVLLAIVLSIAMYLSQRPGYPLSGFLVFDHARDCTPVLLYRVEGWPDGCDEEQSHQIAAKNSKTASSRFP